MSYSWEKESLKKYGEEVTSLLVKKQNDYEEKKLENDCTYCGYPNEGVIVEFADGRPFLLHSGIWVDGLCTKCGRDE